MNLGDYIGDTRTDSLPPGFLKSIKIKYRHEASHVFAGLPPWKDEKATKQCDGLLDDSSQRRDESRGSSKEDGVLNEEQSVPSFMNWRVPSRLLNQKYGVDNVADNEREKSGKAKSASFVSRRTAEPTARSSTCTSLERTEKSAAQNKLKHVKKTSQREKHNTKENHSKINGRENSNRSKYTKGDEKQHEGNEMSVKSGNSNVLEPIPLKLDERNAPVLEAKESVQNKTELRKISENLIKQGTEPDIKIKKDVRLRSQKNVQSKIPELAKLSKEKIPDVSGGSKVDENVMSENGAKKMNAKDDRGVDGKLNLKLKELPKTKGLTSECTQSNPQTRNASLPMIKPSENRTSIKLSQTPERMNKIFDWVSKSSGREREAAFNLLSTYNTKIEAKTPKKKERVRIALQVLERKRIPDSIKPLHPNDVKRSSTVVRLDRRAMKSHSSHIDKKEKEGKKTWHHVAMYQHTDNSNNRGALFVQASKPYQRHFSIHPEWGLHTSVKFTNTVTT